MNNFTPAMSGIIDNIRAIRLFKGFTQEYMADKLSIEPSTYGKTERGQIDLSVNRVEQIADIFGMSVIELYSYMTKSSQMASEPNEEYKITKKSNGYSISIMINIEDALKGKEILELIGFKQNI